jgi:hypothetical protein
VVRYNPVGVLLYIGWHFEGSGPDWRQIRESPAPGPANLREAIGMFCHNSANVHTYASTGDMLGIHSPEWRPKIKSSLGISPDTGDRKINSQARFRQYGDRLKTLFRALLGMRPTSRPGKGDRGESGPGPWTRAQNALSKPVASGHTSAWRKEHHRLET